MENSTPLGNSGEAEFYSSNNNSITSQPLPPAIPIKKQAIKVVKMHKQEEEKQNPIK